jgi:hypothetical protein
VKSWVWDDIEPRIRKRAKVPFFAGLTNRLGGISHDLMLAIKNKTDFLYLDNSYFARGARSTNFRLIRGGLHLTTTLDRPADRRAKWNPTTCEYTRGGRHVLVIPPSPYFVQFYDAGSWLQDTTKQLSLVTDRPVVVKHDKKIPPLAECLSDAWAVVTFASVAGVEAAISGIPVFAGEHCPAYPVTAGTLADIESPKYPDREPWLNSLSYATWNLQEIDNINLEDYRYQCV